MKKVIPVIAIILSALSLIISLICATHSISDANILTAVIAALTLLVTALIGWQIYAVIDIKKIHNEVEESAKKVEMESKHQVIGFHSIVTVFYLDKIAKNDRDTDVLSFLLNCSLSMMLSSWAEDYQTCNVMAKYCEQLRGLQAQRVKVNKETQLKLLRNIAQVKNPDKIRDYPLFLECMYFFLMD